ncbi:DUF551 domain-containing protein [Escherichia coli]|uniref:DUF551 domain-containing protein n=1 Tax=Escherichia coli TaxID=562 RepID=UPI001CEC0EB5|nr:DUF551 domain-containing protein [Escherichia coli]MDI0636716.1 DUF551 domain-containing protein [Escherichia coli]
MSTITKEFTKERLEEIAEDGFLKHGESKELARIALASLEAEAVHQFIYNNPYEEGYTEWLDCNEDYFNGVPEDCRRILYTAPPAPVSVPAAMEIDDDFDSAFEHGKAVGWNAYRAAMLQAEPVSNSDELPLDYLQGHKDGLEWAAQLAEANHPQTGDWLYDDPIDLARAIRKGPDMPTVQGGNSPVTPDGWISCSERMPDDGQHVIILCDGAFVLYAQYRDSEFFDVVRNGEEFFETQSRNVTHWMPLPAAPQQEA